jgi:hypothetical protein
MVDPHLLRTTWVIIIRRERKDSENGREKRLESQNLYDRDKNFSNDKGVRDPG